MSWFSVITTKGRLLEATAELRRDFIAVYGVALEPDEELAMLIDHATCVVRFGTDSKGRVPLPLHVYRDLAAVHGYELGRSPRSVRALLEFFAQWGHEEH